MIRRHDSHKKKKLGTEWRRPRGLHNKVRLGIKGYVRKPAIGERTAVAKRDMYEGKLLVRVENLPQLTEAKGKAIVIANIGMRKEIMILEEGLKQNLFFAFDAKTRLDELKQKYKSRLEASKTAAKVKEVKAEKKTKQDKKEVSTQETTEMSEEEKKKEMDKALIQRQ